eukprot:163683-Hanusia_phi.AAC.2
MITGHYRPGAGTLGLKGRSRAESDRTRNFRVRLSSLRCGTGIRSVSPGRLPAHWSSGGGCPARPCPPLGARLRPSLFWQYGHPSGPQARMAESRPGTLASDRRDQCRTVTP